MSQIDRAHAFKAMHDPGNPVVLYNIWDAGGARAVSGAGARAIATGSWSVAAAHGFKDGEQIPLDFVLMIVERIAHSVDLPVTVDFEGGYAEDPTQLATNITRLIDAGAVGINFEDQVLNGIGLHAIASQAARIKAIRKAADATGVPLFINARTDVFLKADASTPHASLLDEALQRQMAYAEAGADGFFVAGLTDQHVVRQLCERSPLPVNVLMTRNLETLPDMKKTGVSRISFGPAPYFRAMEDMVSRFDAVGR